MNNITLKVPEGDFESLRGELISLGFYEKEVSGTLWSLSNGETHVLLYPSGTLLIQGSGRERIREFVFSRLSVPQVVLVGCDESGKGDVFGPLALCCAVLKPEYYKRALELNPKDCKKAEDEEVIKKAEAFSLFGEFRCKVVEPLELNSMYESLGNLNRILDRLYRELLFELKESYPQAKFFVDAYSARNPFGKPVVFEPKSEKNPAVAMASLLARAEFLKWLRAHQLPKGSSKGALSRAKELFSKDPQRAKRLLKTFFL